MGYKQKHIRLNYNRDAYLAFFLSSLIWFTPLRTFFIEWGNTIRPGVGNMISRLLAVLFMSYAAVRFVKDISVRKRDLLLLCFVFFTWVRSLVFHLNYTGTYLAILLDFIIKVLPFYFVAKNISDWNITKEAMYKGGTVCIVMMAACMFGGGVSV